MRAPAASLASAAVAAALAASGALFAQTLGAPTATMSVDELRPGMRGYGLTVFRGVRPERFDVEVIDVVRGFRPRQDLILIRPSHPQTDHAGTVAGMSGSPIYVDNRLIGAYAYGWEFGRDPVAGVTPIANMRAELARPRRTPPGLMPGWATPVEIAPRRARSASNDPWGRLVEQARAARGPVPTAHGTMVPVMAPDLRAELQAILDLQLADNRKAWELGPDGRYRQRRPAAGEPVRASQQLLMERALRRSRG